MSDPINVDTRAISGFFEEAQANLDKMGQDSTRVGKPKTVRRKRAA